MVIELLPKISCIVCTEFRIYKLELLKCRRINVFRTFSMRYVIFDIWCENVHLDKCFKMLRLEEEGEILGKLNYQIK